MQVFTDLMNKNLSALAIVSFVFPWNSYLEILMPNVMYQKVGPLGGDEDERAEPP